MQSAAAVRPAPRERKEAPNMPWGSGWGMTPPPAATAGSKPVTLLGGWLFSVPKSAKNKAMAWKAIEWLNSEAKDYAVAAKYGMTPRYKRNWTQEPFKSDTYEHALLNIARSARR